MSNKSLSSEQPIVKEEDEIIDDLIIFDVCESLNCTEEYLIGNPPSRCRWCGRCG